MHLVPFRMRNKVTSLDAVAGDLLRDASMEDTSVPVPLLNAEGEPGFPLQGTYIRCQV